MDAHSSSASGGARRTYDLEERTGRFADEVIDLAKKIPVNLITKRLIPQLVAAGTSVNGNYGEAQEAESRKDFRHKLKVCNKEARESKQYLKRIKRACPELATEVDRLWKEAHELNLIFSASIRTLDAKDAAGPPVDVE